MITFEDFAQLDLRIGQIKTAERIPKSKNLLKLTVDVGESTPRQILSGIANEYTPEQLVDRKIIVLTNLKPKKMMNLESKGMLLAADVNDKAILLKLDEKFLDSIKPGTKIH
jgi:methionyl-tRNA synthetase